MPKNKLTDAELQQLENSYTYHPPKDDQPARYVEIRDKAKELATTFGIDAAAAPKWGG